MFEDLLLIVIVLQGFATLYYEYKVERHYNRYFSERDAWRLRQRKSRAKKPNEPSDEIGISQNDLISN